MEFFTWFGLLFVRQALVVLCVGTIVLLILRRIHSPNVHRIACVALLLQGVLLIHWSVLDAPQSTLSRQAISPSTIDTADITQRFDAYDQIHIAATSTTNPSASQPTDFAAPLQLISDTTRNFAPWFFAIWLTGVLLILGWSVVCYLKFNRQLTVIPSQNGQLILQWNAVLRSVQQQSVPLMISEDVGPAVVRRPQGVALIVPLGFLESLTENQREAVFIHEAQHLKRHDLEWSLAIRLLLLLQWLNPVAWLLARRFDEAAEWACDEVCRKRLSGAAVDFAKTVLANIQTPATSLPHLASGMAGHNLTTRIRRLLSHTQEESRMKRVIVFSVIGLFASINVCESWTPAIAQEAARSNGEQAATTEPTSSTTIEKLSGQQLIDRAVEDQTFKPTEADDNQLTITANATRLVKFPSKVSSVTGFDGLTMGVSARSPKLLEITGKKQGRTPMLVQDERGNTWTFTIEIQKAKKPSKPIPNPLPPQAVKANADLAISNAQTNKVPIETGPVIVWDMIICDIPENARFQQAQSDSPKKAQLKNVSATRVTGAAQQSLIFMKTKPTVEALREEAKQLNIDLQIHSTPKIITRNGRPGTLMSGGEFPILVPAGNDTVAIEFRPFGINLECLGNVVGENQIRIELHCEISKCDFSSSVKVNDIVVPGLITRRANYQFTVDKNVTAQLATPSTKEGRVNLIYVTPSIVESHNTVSSETK